MDADSKKTVLRMIPYGIYVMAAKGDDGTIAAATVNWVTQTAFEPPLVVIGVKADSGLHAALKPGSAFALNMLGKGAQGIAFGFFKPTDVTDGKLNGETYHEGATGAPILDAAKGAVECTVAEIVARGDHHIVIGEVVDAHLPGAIEGRPDEAILEMKELGDNVFYGG